MHPVSDPKTQAAIDAINKVHQDSKQNLSTIYDNLSDIQEHLESVLDAVESDMSREARKHFD